MKKAILAMTVFLSVAQAHALHCSLNRENPKTQGQYDQPLFNTLEVLKNGSKQQLVLVKASGEVVENYEFGSIKTPQDLASIDKATMAVVTRNQDGTLAIGVGGIDTSNSNNISPMYSMAIGDAGKLFGVIDYAHKLSLTCFQF